MANQIENIYAKQAEDQLKKILDGLTSIHKKQMELNNNAIDFYGGRTGSNPNELNAVISKYDELSKIALPCVITEGSEKSLGCCVIIIEPVLYFLARL